MNIISIGKIRGLQQISTAQSIFTICAIDHRGSLHSALKKELAREIGYQEMVQYKSDICGALAPYASAILLDPIYGAAQSIARGVLPGRTGLLISVEASGYQSNHEGRVTTLLAGWSVEKIKRMGGSAVKILVYYRPDLVEAAGEQLETVRYVAEECKKYDLPFLVEPVSYPLESERADLKQFFMKKPDLVIETARQITALPIDVLKAEFPADLNYEKNKSKVLEVCQKLSEASRVPWVLLSAGVDYKMFNEQVKLACQAGASGFLGGRAIWQEALQFADEGQRVKYLETTVADRFKELCEITDKYAVPWYRKLGITSVELTSISEDWYRVY